jgi:YgiT-type zinc finger domain-containing protein
MMPFQKCPVCGGEVVEKEVEKLLKGGGNTAAVKVLAEICLQCGEQMYDQETIRCFESIRAKLGRGDVAGFSPTGQSYEIANCGRV